ncbi:MAG: hypothetical protein GX478_08490, partial [Erysipelotrichaceae bacterium]|nr:hypothetical protein [Erysipelotrichaceae bacterium]
MKKRVNVLEGSIPHALLFLMFPILVCGIFQQLYSMVDAIVVGQYVGSAGLAAIGGSCNTLISFFTGITSNMILGCMTVVAFLYGANDRRTNTGITTSLYLSAGVGLIFTLVYTIFASSILQYLSVPEELLQNSAHYLQLYALGFIPYFLFQTCVNLFRAFGETKWPTILLISSFGCNILLDYLFVGLLGMQQNGIALAYIVTQMIFALAAMKSLSHTYMINFAREHADAEILKR